MTQRAFLHPGPPKTGTTYLQSLLYANVGSFLDQGVTITASQARHHQAANELLQAKSRRGVVVPHGAWAAVCREVLAAPGDAVLSCERYSMLHAHHAQRIVADLAGRELHVVFTLRDIAAVLPARWQEQVKNGGSRTWAEFLEQVADSPERLRRWTRATPSLRAWARALPADRIHVVTVPPASAPRTLLLDRFCEVLGVDPATLETREPTRANPSLDLVGTELVRRLNASSATKLSPYAQHTEIKVHVASQLPRRSDRRPALTPEAFQAAQTESRSLVGLVRARGFHVVGDLADLTTTAPPSADRRNVDVDPDEVLEAAAIAISALARRSARRGRQVARLQARPHAAPHLRGAVRGVLSRLRARLRRG